MNYSQKNKTQTNLENFVLRERFVDVNVWQHYVYQADECTVHRSMYIISIRATAIEEQYK